MSNDIENNLWAALTAARLENRPFLHHLILMAIMEIRSHKDHSAPARHDYGRASKRTIQRRTGVKGSMGSSGTLLRC